MTMDPKFYVGALGWMSALPDVDGGTTVDPGRIGGSGQSMYGRQWRDTVGYADQWAWKYDNLLAEQTVFVDALLHGSARGPLRLYDPRRINRVPRQQAAGGSPSASSDGFGVSVGGLQYRDLLAVPPSIDTFPMRHRIKGCQEWVRPNGGGGAMWLAGPELDGTWQAPLLRGETVELFCFVAGPDGMPLSIRWVEYERDQTPHSYYSASQAAAQVALSASAWQKVSVQVTGHSVGVAGASFSGYSVTPRLYLDPATSAAAGSVFATGWQVWDPTATVRHPGVHGACLPAPVTGLWYPGGASPRVVVDPQPGGYGLPGWYSSGLVLTESTITSIAT